MISMATVHATGVNWDAVVAISCSVVAAMSVIGGVFAKLIAGQMTQAIDKFRIEVVMQLDTRLTKLETLATATRRRQTRDDLSA